MMVKAYFKLRQFRSLFIREDGQGMTEYGLILALIAVVVIIVLQSLGGGLTEKFFKICEAVAGQGACKK